jgi:NitT/TauT family transport system substrate-binding protein
VHLRDPSMPTGALPTLHTARRRWLRGGAALGLAALGGAGCSTVAPPLRIGAHPWLGYELMFLAHAHGLLQPGQLRLVEVPSATASLRALAAGTLDGAGLTLDEVLTARARGLMLRVVAVFDVSHGADVLLGSPDITSLSALRGRRVGVEHSATGALVLDAALHAGGLAAADVRMVPLSFDEHAAALRAGEVDAVVTFDPVRSQLLADGAQQLFSSAQVPGLIVDVLAVRAEAVHSQGTHLRTLVAGVLQARSLWQQDSAGSAARMAPRLQLSPAAVVQAFSLVQLPDLAANHRWLGGPRPALMAAAERLQAVMRRAALLPPTAQPLAGPHADAALADARFLPAL